MSIAEMQRGQIRASSAGPDRGRPRGLSGGLSAHRHHRVARRHNPIGLDTLKIHQLAIRCAQAGGGLVFPPLYYGESREEGLMEANAADREEIHAVMGLPSENFAPATCGSRPQQQYENYQRLLFHCLYQMQSLGFQVLVIAAGHYPLLDHARAACAFPQARWNNRRWWSIGWAFTGYELVRDVYPEAGDHAGYLGDEPDARAGAGPDRYERIAGGSAPPLVGIHTQAGPGGVGEYGSRPRV